MSLKDKIALVTGGSKGIGYAIAKRLAEGGAKVYICARGREEVEAAVTRLSEIGEAYGKVCDVRDEEQVKRLLESCESRLGGIDILVNNAGVGIM